MPSVLYVSAMLAALGGLFALSRVLLSSPCWVLFFMVAAVAWPMWVGAREFALFQHRINVAALTRETSRVRQWFWRGTLTSNLQLLYALFWAALLLAVSATLSSWHIALLALDILVLAGVMAYARRVLQRDVRAELVGMLSRRWLVFAINVTFLALGALMIGYFIGVPDTRGSAWNVVAERAFVEYYSNAACPLAGSAAGVINAMDRLTWHAAQVLIPSLPGPWLRVAAWLLFLLQAGVVAFAYTYLQLGVITWVETRASGSRPRDGNDFPAMLPVLAVLSLLLAYALKGFDPAALRGPAENLVREMNPCRLEAKAVRALKNDLSTRIEQVRVSEHRRVATQIDGALDTMFLDVEKGVDEYLDWYFSMIGEYSRLLAWAANVDKAQFDIQRELEKRVFEHSPLAPRLSALNTQLAADSGAKMSVTAQEVGSHLAGAQVKPCWADSFNLPAIPEIKRDVVRASVAVGGGFAVGIATRAVLAGRFSQAVVGRLASKRAFQGAATVAARLSARRASTLVVAGSAATVCSPGGPLAGLCALVAGGLTWIAIDKTMIKIDEVRYRDEMRKEILDALGELKAEIAREMRAAHTAYIDAMARSLDESVDKVFIPARDGLGVV